MSETSTRKIWEMLKEQYLTKSVESKLHLKSRLYRFQLKGGTSLSYHIITYAKFLAELANVDEKIKDEDTTLVLLSSLPDEYETFVMTLINGKTSHSYSDVKPALVNLELRRTGKESFSSTSAEALTARWMSSNKKNGGNCHALLSRLRVFGYVTTVRHAFFAEKHDNA